MNRKIYTTAVLSAIFMFSCQENPTDEYRVGKKNDTNSIVINTNKENEFNDFGFKHNSMLWEKGKLIYSEDIRKGLLRNLWNGAKQCLHSVVGFIQDSVLPRVVTGLAVGGGLDYCAAKSIGAVTLPFNVVLSAGLVSASSAIGFGLGWVL